MGFLLFNQSGTFSPVNLGLNIGDTLFVTCVGGGGGGGCDGDHFVGGNGGASSFGTHVTSLGGSGGGASTASGTFNGGDKSQSAAGGGAGGWLAGYDCFGGDAKQPHSGNDGCIAKFVFGKNFAGYNAELETMPFPVSGTSGVSKYYPISMNYDDLSLHKIPYYSDAQNATGAVVTDYLTSQTYFRPKMNTFINVGWVCGGDSSQGQFYSAYPSGNYIYTQSIGGVGYGAGGAGYAGCSSGDGSISSSVSSGGNSGEIKSIQVTLSSISNISVTVGGGGSGASGHLYSGYRGSNGNAGGAGYGGATSFDYGGGNAGGYGDSPSGKTPRTYGLPSNTTNDKCAAGGGASGCVAVWW